MSPQCSSLTQGSAPLSQAQDSFLDPLDARRCEGQHNTHRAILYANQAEQSSSTLQPVINIMDDRTLPANLWSLAYREAVESLGSEVNTAILQGKNIEQLFEDLRRIDDKATQESAFHRGLKHLRSIQVPLERFKLVLDLASPLTSLHPAA